jgi:hypothetical protein
VDFWPSLEAARPHPVELEELGLPPDLAETTGGLSLPPVLAEVTRGLSDRLGVLRWSLIGRMLFTFKEMLDVGLFCCMVWKIRGGGKGSSC